MDIQQQQQKPLHLSTSTQPSSTFMSNVMEATQPESLNTMDQSYHHAYHNQFLPQQTNGLHHYILQPPSPRASSLYNISNNMGRPGALIHPQYGASKWSSAPSSIPNQQRFHAVPLQFPLQPQILSPSSKEMAVSSHSKPLSSSIYHQQPSYIPSDSNSPQRFFPVATAVFSPQEWPTSVVTATASIKHSYSVQNGSSVLQSQSELKPQPISAVAKKGQVTKQLKKLKRKKPRTESVVGNGCDSTEDEESGGKNFKNFKSNDTLVSSDKPKCRTPRKKVRKKVETSPPRPPSPLTEPYYDEDIIENFLFGSFDTLEDLDRTSLWCETHEGKMPDPMVRLRLDMTKKKEKKKEKKIRKIKIKTVEDIPLAPPPSPNKVSNGSSSEKGYICDSDSDSGDKEDSVNGGVDDLFNISKVVCRNGLPQITSALTTLTTALPPQLLPTVPLPASVAQSLTVPIPYSSAVAAAAVAAIKDHPIKSTSETGVQGQYSLYRPYSISPPTSLAKIHPSADPPSSGDLKKLREETISDFSISEAKNNSVSHPSYDDKPEILDTTETKNLHVASSSPKLNLKLNISSVSQQQNNPTSTSTANVAYTRELESISLTDSFSSQPGPSTQLFSSANISTVPLLQNFTSRLTQAWSNINNITTASTNVGAGQGPMLALSSFPPPRLPAPPPFSPVSFNPPSVSSSANNTTNFLRQELDNRFLASTLHQKIPSTSPRLFSHSNLENSHLSNQQHMSGPLYLANPLLGAKDISKRVERSPDIFFPGRFERPQNSINFSEISSPPMSGVSRSATVSKPQKVLNQSLNFLQKSKKNGKWNAMHARICWEIYNHQQKQNLLPVEKSSAKMPAASGVVERLKNTQTSTLSSTVPKQALNYSSTCHNQKRPANQFGTTVCTKSTSTAISSNSPVFQSSTFSPHLSTTPYGLVRPPPFLGPNLFGQASLDPLAAHFVRFGGSHFGGLGMGIAPPSSSTPFSMQQHAPNIWPLTSTAPPPMENQQYKRDSERRRDKRRSRDGVNQGRRETSRSPLRSSASTSLSTTPSPRIFSQIKRDTSRPSHSPNANNEVTILEAINGAGGGRVSSSSVASCGSDKQRAPSMQENSLNRNIMGGFPSLVPPINEHGGIQLVQTGARQMATVAELNAVAAARNYGNFVAPSSMDPRNLYSGLNASYSAGPSLDPYRDPYRAMTGINTFNKDPLREARERELLRINPLGSMIMNEQGISAAAAAARLHIGYPETAGIILPPPPIPITFPSHKPSGGIHLRLPNPPSGGPSLYGATSSLQPAQLNGHIAHSGREHGKEHPR